MRSQFPLPQFFASAPPAKHSDRAPKLNLFFFWGVLFSVYFSLPFLLSYCWDSTKFSNHLSGLLLAFLSSFCHFPLFGPFRRHAFPLFGDGLGHLLRVQAPPHQPPFLPRKRQPLPRSSQGFLFCSFFCFFCACFDNFLVSACRRIFLKVELFPFRFFLRLFWPT